MNFLTVQFAALLAAGTVCAAGLHEAAPDAVLHLDGSDLSAFEIIAGTNVVRSWGAGPFRVFRVPLPGEDAAGYPFNPRLVANVRAVGGHSLSAVYFDGVDDYLNLSGNIVLDEGNYELFAVAWADEAGAGPALLGFSGRYSPFGSPVIKNARLIAGFDPTNAKMYPFEPMVFHVRGDLSTDAVTPPIDFTLSTNFTASGRAYQSRIGGDSRSISTNDPRPNGKDFRGTVGELFFYNKELTAAERSNTICYLSAKWGIDATDDNPVRRQETGLENPALSLKKAAAGVAALRTNGLPLYIGMAANSGFRAGSFENAKIPPKYGPKYLRRMGADFNAFVLPNNLKMERLRFKESTGSNVWNFSTADAELTELLNAAAARGESCLIRGHTLIWKKANPDWLTGEIASNRVNRMEDMGRHLTEVLTHFAKHPDSRLRSAISAWDLVNEPIHPAEPSNLFDPLDPTYDPLRSSGAYDRLFSQSGDGVHAANPWFAPVSQGAYHWMVNGQTQKVDYVEYAFRKASEVLAALYLQDPENRPDLFLNEFGIETEEKKWNTLITLLKYWLRRGVPIDGVGFQCHIGMFGFDPGAFARRLDTLKALGLKVHITELDVAMPLPRTNRKMELQKEIYRQVIETAAANDHVEAILTWGLSDSWSDAGNNLDWVPDDSSSPSLLFTYRMPEDAESYQPKPAYFSVREALNKVAAPR